MLTGGGGGWGWRWDNINQKSFDYSFSVSIDRTELPGSFKNHNPNTDNT